MTNDARYRILEELCTRLEADGFARPVPKREVVERVVQEPYLTADDVDYHAYRLAERGYIDGPDGDDETLTLLSRGVGEFEQLSGTTVVPRKLRDDILAALVRARRETPEDPGMTVAAVAEELDAETDEVSVAVYYLEGHGLVETIEGGGDGGASVQITEHGRRWSGD